MWSSPVKRTAPDGSEYSLLLLDSEGIDAYNQTASLLTLPSLEAILFSDSGALRKILTVGE
jgi:hypothetical protein